MFASSVRRPGAGATGGRCTHVLGPSRDRPPMPCGPTRAGCRSARRRSDRRSGPRRAVASAPSILPCRRARYERRMPGARERELGADEGRRELLAAAPVGLMTSGAERLVDLPPSVESVAVPPPSAARPLERRRVYRATRVARERQSPAIRIRRHVRRHSDERRLTRQRNWRQRVPVSFSFRPLAETLAFLRAPPRPPDAADAVCYPRRERRAATSSAAARRRRSEQGRLHTSKHGGTLPLRSRIIRHDREQVLYRRILSTTHDRRGRHCNRCATLASSPFVDLEQGLEQRWLAATQRH